MTILDDTVTGILANMSIIDEAADMLDGAAKLTHRTGDPSDVFVSFGYYGDAHRLGECMGYHLLPLVAQVEIDIANIARNLHDEAGTSDVCARMYTTVVNAHAVIRGLAEREHTPDRRRHMIDELVREIKKYNELCDDFNTLNAEPERVMQPLEYPDPGIGELPSRANIIDEITYASFRYGRDTHKLRILEIAGRHLLEAYDRYDEAKTAATVCRTMPRTVPALINSVDMCRRHLILFRKYSA